MIHDAFFYLLFLPFAGINKLLIPANRRPADICINTVKTLKHSTLQENGVRDI